MGSNRARTAAYELKEKRIKVGQIGEGLIIVGFGHLAKGKQCIIDSRPPTKGVVTFKS